MQQLAVTHNRAVAQKWVTQPHATWRRCCPRCCCHRRSTVASTAALLLLVADDFLLLGHGGKGAAGRRLQLHLLHLQRLMRLT